MTTPACEYRIGQKTDVQSSGGYTVATSPKQPSYLCDILVLADTPVINCVKPNIKDPSKCPARKILLELQQSQTK